MNYRAIQGDIQHIPADALITAINPYGNWWGGIDGVIQRCAGDQFHDQAREAMPLEDGQTVVARQREPHLGGWHDVVFIVDALQLPLDQLVERALRAAEQAGYMNIVMPAIRTGLTLECVEGSAEEAVTLLRRGILRHLDRISPQQQVTVVIYNDALLYDLLVRSN